MISDREQEQYLKAMIESLPERDVPAGLVRRIMEQVSGPEKNAGVKFIQYLKGLVLMNGGQWIRPACILCALAGTFWLGFALGGNDSGGNGERHISSGSRQSLMISEDAVANFHVGRGFLAAGKWKEAASFLLKARRLAPGNPEYTLWAGVALGKIGDQAGERDMYRKTLSMDSDFFPAHLYLGHALLENGQPAAALEEYSQVLDVVPLAGPALYNSALASRQLGLQDEAVAFWRKYLEQNRSGVWAYRAVAHLNQRGDFSYRSYQIGFRRTILDQEALLGPDTPARQQEVAYLVDSFRQASADELNIVVFETGGLPLAERRAWLLKRLVSEKLTEFPSIRVRTSWFALPEEIHLPSGKQVSLKRSLLIFSKPTLQRIEEKKV